VSDKMKNTPEDFIPLAHPSVFLLPLNI
jgi:hypothetical protein